MSDYEPTKVPIDAATFGTDVHDSIENVLVESDIWPTEHTDRLTRAFVSEFDRLRDDDLADYLVKRGHECCQVAAKYLVAEQPEIHDVEGSYKYRINDGTEREIDMSTRLDIMTTSEVWDWKTGSLKDEDGNVRSYIPHEEKIQGAAYMASFHHELGYPPDIIKFVYLREGVVRKVEPDDDTWDYMMRHSRRLEMAKENNEFPGQAGGHCFLCSYEGWCPTAPAGVGGMDFDEYLI